MDELNDFMEDQGLPDDLTVRLREFFNHSRNMEKMKVYSSLLSRMSPGLRGEVAMLAYGPMLETVPYFEGTGESFLTTVAVQLSAIALSPGEMVVAGDVPADAIYFVADGVVSQHGKILSIGYHFGDEVILETGLHRFPVRAITFCSLHVLSKEAIQEVLAMFPAIAKKVRKAAIRMAFRRDVVRTIKRLTVGETAQVADTSVTGELTVEEVRNAAMDECLASMQKLQQQLLEKDEEVKRAMEESTVLQEGLLQQIPLLETQLKNLAGMRTASNKSRSAEEKGRLTATLDTAKGVMALQDRIATESASQIKASQYKFWKSRQVLVRNTLSGIQ